MSAPARLRVAYLNSQYPAISHTFIEREIQAVRAQGIDVITYSVRPCPSTELLSESMRREDASTRAIHALSKSAVAAIGRDLLARHPAAAGAAALLAARSGLPTPRGKLWQGFYLAQAAVLHAWMRQDGLRHVHVHMANVSADIARLACAIGNAIDGEGRWTWSLTVHGPAEFELSQQWDLSAKLADALAISCISDFCRSQLMRYAEPRHWSTMRVVRMAVDADRFAPPTTSRNHSGPIRLVTVGRLVPEKGSPVLIDALATLARRGIRTQTRIIGDGPLRAQLARDVHRLRLEDDVSLLGAVSQDVILEHYHWADAFVLPSFMEGLPVVLMEAMASGLPVVSTSIAAIPDLVHHQLNGLLIPPGRADRLADAIAELASDPARRHAYGRRGREAVLSDFTPATTGPAMATFLRDALDAGAGAVDATPVTTSGVRSRAPRPAYGPRGTHAAPHGGRRPAGSPRG